MERAQHLLNDASSVEQQAMLSRFVVRIDLAPGQLRIALDLAKLRLLVLAGRSDSRTLMQAEFPRAHHVLTLPFALRRRGVEMKLLMDNGVPEGKLDLALIGLVAKAYRWFQALAKGEVESIEELASRESADVNEISRVLQLAFLAPEVLEMIVAGKQPLDLTLMKLKRISYLPFGWTDQGASLQF